MFRTNTGAAACTTVHLSLSTRYKAHDSRSDIDLFTLHAPSARYSTALTCIARCSAAHLSTTLRAFSCRRRAA